MSSIKTNLRTTATDRDGNIDLHCNISPRAFSGVFHLGLIMGSQDADTKRLPVDDDELPRLQTAINNVTQECLHGLAGIGSLIEVSQGNNHLTDSDFYGIGLVIKNLAVMVQECQDYQEVIDLRARKPATTGDKQSFAELIDTVVEKMIADGHSPVDSDEVLRRAKGGL